MEDKNEPEVREIVKSPECLILVIGRQDFQGCPGHSYQPWLPGDAEFFREARMDDTDGVETKSRFHSRAPVFPSLQGFSGRSPLEKILKYTDRMIDKLGSIDD